MKKVIMGFVIAGIVLVGGTTVFLTSQKDESKVAKTIIEIPEQKSVLQNTTLRTGSFNYLDPLHYGEGSVDVIDAGEFYKIKFASNFKSADAPDPYVYLGSAQEFKDRAVAGVDTSKTINLAKLKAFSGEQEYLVSKKDFEAHDAAVIIWCKQFGVQISRADLK
jgi:hypothetical protein